MASSLEDALLQQLTFAGLPIPTREFPFAKPERSFRWDFCWPARMLALEVDGGTWNYGRHTTGSGVERDAEKQCLGAILGWRQMRVTSTMVRSGLALRLIERALKEAKS